MVNWKGRTFSKLMVHIQLCWIIGFVFFLNLLAKKLKVPVVVTLLDLVSLLPKVDAETENWLQVAYLWSQEAGHERAAHEKEGRKANRNCGNEGVITENNWGPPSDRVEPYLPDPLRVKELGSLFAISCPSSSVGHSWGHLLPSISGLPQLKGHRKPQETSMVGWGNLEGHWQLLV